MHLEIAALATDALSKVNVAIQSVVGIVLLLLLHNIPAALCLQALVDNEEIDVFVVVVFIIACQWLLIAFVALVVETLAIDCVFILWLACGGT